MGQTNSTNRPSTTKKNLISNNNNITADSNIISTKNANKKLYKRQSTVCPSANDYINSDKKQTVVDVPTISGTTQKEIKIAIIDCQPIESTENGAIDLTITRTLPDDGDVSVVYRNRNTIGPELIVQKQSLQSSTSDVELRMTTTIVKATKPVKEKKKKKEKEIAVESGNTYHKTNSCYYKLENGTFFKFPSNTFHKSNDGCYTKLSNGSFRHLLFKNKEMPGFDGEEMNAGSGGNISQPVPQTKHSRASMPANATTKLHNDSKSPSTQTSGVNHHVTTTTALQQNRKVMVTMIDGGLPVVAVSKPNKTTTKKDKNKVI